MKVRINGLEKEFPASLNLKTIVGQFCKDTRHVIAEVNGDIVKSAQWEEKNLKSGDSIELVNFVGGG